jgi:myo-inositol-1(or 4)-monophosphatase
MGPSESGGRLKAIQEIAIKAGGLIKRMAAEGPKVTHKGPVDLVTQADIEAERLIIEELRRLFPGEGILAEESGGDSGAETLWVVDPIDGTTNYAHGFPVYAVSIGLLVKGRSSLGVVYDPNLDEMFAAQRGFGTTLNERPIRVSSVSRLDQALLATGFPYALRDDSEKIVADFARVAVVAQGVRRPGAATLDLCNIACGRFDGFWEVGLRPWDTAAAALIVEEAGGRITDYADRPFDHFKAAAVASNGFLHRQLLEILQRQP